MADQNKIGWDNALAGILAISWLDVARHGHRGPSWEAERKHSSGHQGMLFFAHNACGRDEIRRSHGSTEQELTTA
jgi:hypothetical protein